MAYVTTSSLMFVNAAIVMMAPSSTGWGCVIRRSATPKVTAVPRDWPTSATWDGGSPRVSSAQWTAARPSVMRPCSEGVPLERPKPR
jgi:hypothetical protein